MDGLLDDPQRAFITVFPPSHPLRQRPQSCPDTQWRNHLLALHAVVYEMCSLATGSSFLDLMLGAARELLPPGASSMTDDNKAAAAPAHHFNCNMCRCQVEMTRKEVAWFTEKHYSLPKRCKACRSARR